MSDWIPVIIAVLSTISAVGAGMGAAWVQMRKSRKAGVENRHVQAESPEGPEAPETPSPIDGFNKLTTQLQSQLERVSATQERDRQRLDHVEAWNVTLGDHVDVLESHIWQGKPPPPPPRPRYTPFASPNPKE